MALKAQKVPVSERALIQRISRKLWDDDQVVKTTRGGQAEMALGRHYILDWKINGIMHKDIDLEDWGRKLGVLKTWEKVS
jgi:hypothetical protein